MLTFVLGGGGARGAFQVGALQALIEAGYRPQLLVGASVGALNAAFLALHGVNATGVAALRRVWQSAAQEDLLAARRAWLAAQALLQREDRRYYERLRQFCIHQGLAPDLHFGQIEQVRLIVVATDLNHGQPVLFGASPFDNVLEALLASAALPPWILPIEAGDRLLTDGGFVSNLPIEPALRQGASEIIALDVSDMHGLGPDARGAIALFTKAAVTAALRQRDLEMALAAARGVSVRHLELVATPPTAAWDFSHVEAHMTEGYAITQQAIAGWGRPARGWWARSALTRRLRQWRRAGD